MEEERNASQNRFPFFNRFPRIKNPGIGSVERKGLSGGIPTGFHFSPLMAARRTGFLGTGLHPGTEKERKTGSGKPLPDPPVRLKQKTDCPNGNNTGV